jgi:hypothetical protein
VGTPAALPDLAKVQQIAAPPLFEEQIDDGVPCGKGGLEQGPGMLPPGAGQPQVGRFDRLEAGRYLDEQPVSLDGKGRLRRAREVARERAVQQRDAFGQQRLS